MNDSSERNADHETLFAMPQVEPAGPATEVPRGGRPRMQRPDRHQVAIRMLALDGLLAEDHQARLVWQYVDGLDMRPLYDLIRAVEGRAGRNPIDPKILMGLCKWRRKNVAPGGRRKSVALWPLFCWIAYSGKTFPLLHRSDRSNRSVHEHEAMDKDPPRCIGRWAFQKASLPSI